MQCYRSDQLFSSVLPSWQKNCPKVLSRENSNLEFAGFISSVWTSNLMYKSNNYCRTSVNWTFWGTNILFIYLFQVDKHRDSLLNYIIFLRITPFLPNWFINMTSPVIGVPVFPFVFGTFLGKKDTVLAWAIVVDHKCANSISGSWKWYIIIILTVNVGFNNTVQNSGVAPPSLLAIQAGKTLHTLTSASDAVSPLQFIMLIVLGFVSMIPVAFKHYFRKKLE